MTQDSKKTGARIIKIITAVIYGFRNTLERLSLVSISSLVQCLGTNTLAYYGNFKLQTLKVLKTLGPGLMLAKVEYCLPLGSHTTDPETETREGTRLSLVVLSEHT